MTKREPNLFLIGLRGSGKSTLARALALAQDRRMIDLDDLTLARFGDCASISEVFDRYGEMAFRRAESDALQQAIKDHAGVIIALGGGTPTAPGAADLIEQVIRSGEAHVAYLRCQPDMLRARLQQQSEKQQADRPSLTGADEGVEIEQVFRARDDLYQKLATRKLNDIASVDEGLAQLADWTDW